MIMYSPFRLFYSAITSNCSPSRTVIFQQGWVWGNLCLSVTWKRRWCWIRSTEWYEAWIGLGNISMFYCRSCVVWFFSNIPHLIRNLHKHSLLSLLSFAFCSYRTREALTAILSFQHERICEFPSKEFYNGILKTGATPKDSVLLAQSHHLTPILFGHVSGKEISLVVSTERGNENSKANSAEAEESVSSHHQAMFGNTVNA